MKISRTVLLITAAAVTATAVATGVAAANAAPGGDPVFWFDPVDAPTDALGRPHAYDDAGTELPAGNNKVHGII